MNDQNISGENIMGIIDQLYGNEGAGDHAQAPKVKQASKRTYQDMNHDERMEYNSAETRKATAFIAWVIAIGIIISIILGIVIAVNVHNAAGSGSANISSSAPVQGGT